MRWLLACFLSGSIACAPFLLVRQRTNADCAVAALAMLTQRPYTSIATVFVRAHIPTPTPMDAVLAVARALGQPLTPQPLSSAPTGLLFFSWCTDPSVGHVVYVQQGIIFDPLGVTDTVSDYTQTHCFTDVIYYARHRNETRPSRSPRGSSR